VKRGRWRHIFGILGWAGLVALPLVLWAMSDYRPDSLVWLWPNGAALAIQNASGRLGLGYAHPDFTDDSEPRLTHVECEVLVEDNQPDYFGSDPLPPFRWLDPGFQHEKWRFQIATGHSGGTLFNLFVPYWAFSPFILAAIIWPFCGPLRRRYRAKHHLCLTCGYDLRASSDRCPECGSAIAAKV
jgi:hypothetical protein